MRAEHVTGQRKCLLVETTEFGRAEFLSCRGAHALRKRGICGGRTRWFHAGSRTCAAPVTCSARVCWQWWNGQIGASGFDLHTVKTLGPPRQRKHSPVGPSTRRAVVQVRRARGPSPRRFGQRCAITSARHLRGSVDFKSFWIESTPAGWLFLAPRKVARYAPGCRSFSPPRPAKHLSRLVGESKVIKKLITEPMGEVAVYNCAPAFLEQMSGEGWLAVGGAPAFTILYAAMELATPFAAPSRCRGA